MSKYQKLWKYIKGNNNWNFTRLGKLDITDVNEIKDFLNAGNGKTDIVLSLVQ